MYHWYIAQRDGLYQYFCYWLQQTISYCIQFAYGIINLLANLIKTFIHALNLEYRQAQRQKNGVL
jgi:hypothetical protein